MNGRDRVVLEGARRRVLMIAQAFPPTGGSGVQRSAKFAKYLPQFGWTPVVWSAGPMPNWPVDESLLTDLPTDLDHRVQPCPSFRRLFGKLGRADSVERMTELASDDTASPRGLRPAARNGADRWERFRTALAWRWGRITREGRLWMLPDDQLPWALASLPALRRIVRRERIDVIYSTFSPASNHLLAWLLKRYTGLPWVADFRDLWTDNVNYGDPWRVRHRLRSWLERKFLEAADVVVGVSPDQTGILAGHVPDQADKFATIPNGGDVSDFADLTQRASRQQLGIAQDRFVLSFVGRSSSYTEPLAIMGGVDAFLRRYVDAREMFEFRMVGVVPPSVMRCIERAGVRPTITGYVPHDRATREMVAADVLIVGCSTTGRNCGSIVPAKVYEYMAAGRPILSVGTEDGATDKLIHGCRNCVTVPGDSQRVCEALSDMWTQWVDGVLEGGCDPARFAPYSRETLTGRLSRILDRLTFTNPAIAISTSLSPGRCKAAACPMDS